MRECRGLGGWEAENESPVGPCLEDSRASSRSPWCGKPPRQALSVQNATKRGTEAPARDTAAVAERSGRRHIRTAELYLPEGTKREPAGEWSSMLTARLSRRGNQKTPKLFSPRRLWSIQSQPTVCGAPVASRDGPAGTARRQLGGGGERVGGGEDPRETSLHVHCPQGGALATRGPRWRPQGSKSEIIRHVSLPPHDPLLTGDLCTHLFDQGQFT